MSVIPFQHIDWANIPKEEHPGTTGTSFWQTVLHEGLRVRIVTYTAGYQADHWCRKGHIVHCLEGSFTSEEGKRDGNGDAQRQYLYRFRSAEFTPLFFKRRRYAAHH